jgi:glycosyltransferase involved in cell wall biosynthesis
VLPRLSVVVLSYHEGDRVLGAVDSVLAQSAPVELVVSHSGPKPVEDLLRRERPSVRVVASPHRRLPGAARNAGIVATSAPFVAFLAADCRARPGWAAARLEAHLAGAQAVGSSIVPAERTAAAAASHLLQHSNRMPGVRTPPNQRFGVSYARGLFEAHGLFRGDLLFAEDLEFNARLRAAGVEIVPGDGVVVEHVYPTTARALVRDQFARGRRRASAGDHRWHAEVVGRAFGSAGAAVAHVSRGTSPYRRRDLVALAPLLAAGALAKAAGAAVGSPPSPAGCLERDFHHARL